ncbi:hypothetical protein ABE10_25300 [Bacillus toyonensis]|nr:hypothetical protein [Bacillus toyonensis]
MSGPVNSSKDLDLAATAMVMSILNSETTPSHPSFSWLKSSLTQIVLGITEQAVPSDYCLSKAEVEIYTRAQQVMTSRFSDKTLTMRDISEEVGVTPSYIQRIFRQMGRSPMGFLRDYRAAKASQILSSDIPGPKHAESVANATGFRNVRAMRSALSAYRDLAESTEKNLAESTEKR